MRAFIKKYFITDRAFYASMVAIVIPIAMQNIISFGVNMMDTLMLGQLGDVALSAASLGAQPFYILMGLGFGLSSGGAVLISQYWGKGNREAIRTIMGLSMRIMMAGAVLFTLVCFFFPRQLMSLYTHDGVLADAAAIYLKNLSFSFLFYCVANNYMMSMRAVESVKFSTCIYCMSFFVNVFFNYCFIFGKFGFPRLEIQGAAVGTVVARFSEFLAVMVYMNLLEKKVGYRLKDLARRAGTLLPDYVKHSLPVVGNELMWSIGSTVTAMIIGRIGAVFVAANSIIGVLMQLSSVFIFGVANAASVLTGKTIGEGRIRDAQKTAYTLWAMALAMGLLSSGLIMVFRTPILGLYSVSQETKEVAYRCMGVLAMLQPVMALDISAVVGILRGGGDTRTSLMLDCGSLWLVGIPLGAITGLYLHLPPHLVYLFIKMDSPVKTVLAGIRIASGKWIRSVTREDI